MFAYTKIMQGIQAVSAAVTDAYFNLVTLLLPGNGTNGAQNNTFLDSSTNNFTITRNGNTTQGTFSPFSQTGWSSYFNGSDAGVYATVSAAGTGVFTYEAFVFVNAYGAGNTTIFRTNNTSGALDMSLLMNSSGQLVSYNNGGTLLAQTTTTLTRGAWSHVALIRNSSNVIEIYINGVASRTSGSGSSTDNLTYTRLDIGCRSNDGVETINAYISNARYCKSAVYTSAFTPSTSPLTSTSQGATSCQLLTCQDNRWIDNSGNSNTISVRGTPSVQAFSPFAPTAAYSAATNGGSGYFDGTGDELNAGSNAAFAFGTGAYTVECWVYLRAAVSGTHEPCFVFNDTTNGFGFWNANGGSQLQIAVRGGAAVLGSTTTLVANSWNHVVAVRSGTGANQTAIFLNGSRVANGTDSTNWSITGALKIGGITLSNYYLNGHMAGLRIVKGSAVYDPTQSTLTVPAAPPTNITNTSLLLNFTNSGITDATAKNDLETVGNAQISTTQSKFGGSSMYFDGNGDYLIAPNSKLYAFQSANFTVEMWVYPSTVSAVQYLFDTRDPASTTSAGIQWYINASAKLGVYVGTTAVITASTTSLSANTWTHLALVKNGSTWTLYINGTADATTGTNSTALTQEFLTIACSCNQRAATTTDKYSGYIDDLRITNGYARYTASFTPPTAAFPVQ